MNTWVLCFIPENLRKHSGFLSGSGRNSFNIFFFGPHRHKYFFFNFSAWAFLKVSRNCHLNHLDFLKFSLINFCRLISHECSLAVEGSGLLMVMMRICFVNETTKGPLSNHPWKVLCQNSMTKGSSNDFDWNLCFFYSRQHMSTERSLCLLNKHYYPFHRFQFSGRQLECRSMDRFKNSSLITFFHFYNFRFVSR